MTKTNALVRSSATSPAALAVTIRRATPADAPALARLAALDSGPLPQAALVAEVDGVLWAARSLTDGAVVADPFRWTADLVELLHERARHLEAAARPARSPRTAALAALLRPRRHGVGSP